MNSTPLISIALFVLAAFFGAIGQFFYKSGTDAAAGDLASYLLNWRILAGVVCYIAVMVLFVAAFRHGGSLTVLYPIYASTFIWAAVIGRWAYATPILPIHVAGWALLIGGMFLMGWQSDDPSTPDVLAVKGSSQEQSIKTAELTAGGPTDE